MRLRVILAAGIVLLTAGTVGYLPAAQAAPSSPGPVTKDFITEFFMKPRFTRTDCHVTRVYTETRNLGTVSRPKRVKQYVMDSSCGTFNHYSTVTVVPGRTYTLSLNFLAKVVSVTEVAAQ